MIVPGAILPFSWGLMKPCKVKAFTVISGATIIISILLVVKEAAQSNLDIASRRRVSMGSCLNKIW